jgi:hypothetical protein
MERKFLKNTFINVYKTKYASLFLFLLKICFIVVYDETQLVWKLGKLSFLFVLLVQGMLSYNAGYHCFIPTGYVFSALIF